MISTMLVSLVLVTAQPEIPVRVAFITDSNPAAEFLADFLQTKTPDNVEVIDGKSQKETNQKSAEGKGLAADWLVHVDVSRVDVAGNSLLFPGNNTYAVTTVIKIIDVHSQRIVKTIARNSIVSRKELQAVAKLVGFPMKLEFGAGRDYNNELLKLIAYNVREVSSFFSNTRGSVKTIAHSNLE